MSRHTSLGAHTMAMYLIILAVMVSILVPVSVSLAAAPADQVSDGKALFQANCAACHGANAAGGIKVGSVTSPDIRASALSDTFKGNTALISRAILQGKDEQGQDLDPAMPRFQGKLSDTQVNDIIAFLNTSGTAAAAATATAPTATTLPKTGGPLGGLEALWLGIGSGLLTLSGVGIRRALRKQR